MKNIKILRYLLVGGIFASLIIPFITISDLYFPFITGKAYAFRVLVEVLLGLWLVLAIFDKNSRPKKSCILWSTIAFLAIVLIANLKGLNPGYSFWSNYERMEGYVTLLHLFAYFLVISSVFNNVFNTKDIWNKFFNAIAGISIVHAGYAILQATGTLAVGMSADRIDGTFGNATYLAAYMLLSAFITVYLLMKGNKYNWAKYFYIVAIILQTITIFLTATRGTLIALIGGGFLTILIYAILEKENKKLRLGVLASLIAIIAFVSVVFGMKESSFVKDTVALRRLSEISLDSGTVKARFVNWGIAWNAIKEKPLLGYGQGNYGIIFDKNYDVRMWDQEQWFDRVHNLFFDWLIAAGFLGLLSYLSIISAALYYLWKKTSGFSNVEKSAFTAMLAAYFVHVMFVFDSLTSYMLLFILLAYIHSKVSSEIKIIEKINFNKNIAATIAVIFLAATPVMVWAVNADSYLQNRAILKSMKVASEGDVKGGFEIIKSGINRRTFGEQETLMQLLDFSNKVIKTENIDKSLKQEFVNLSAIEIDSYIKKNPEDARTILVAGQFIAQTGNLDLALEFFNRATEISPKKQFLYAPVIAIKIQQGKIPEALDLAKNVYELNKENDNFWMSYVELSLRAKDTKLYNDLIEEAFNTGRGDRVIALAESNFRANPNNAQAYASLAVAHYRSGNSEKAVAILEELSQLFPESKAQADLIIQKIKAGEKIF